MRRIAAPSILSGMFSVLSWLVVNGPVIHTIAPLLSAAPAFLSDWAGAGVFAASAGLVAFATSRSAAPSASSAEEAYRRLSEWVPVGLFRCVVDAGGVHIVDANHALVEMLGYASRDELLGTPVEALYESLAEQRPGETAAAASATIAVTAPVEVRLRTWQGQIVIARVRYEVAAASDGEQVEYVGVVENLTGQREAEQAAAASGSRLATFFEHANVGMSVVDLDMRLIEVNPALCRIMGRPADELLGQTHDGMVHPDERGIDLAAFQAALHKTQNERYVVERRFVRADGAVLLIRLVASLVRDAEGRPQYGVATYEDVTDLRRAAEDLADEVWERSQVAAALSGLRAGPDIEATAARICRALMELPDVDMAGLYDLSGKAAFPLALKTPKGAPVSIGRPVPRSRTRELRARARQGPWLRVWEGASTRYERAWLEVGIKASGYVPLTWDDGVVGLLVVGSSSEEAARGATRWLSSLAEYGVVASALLGHDLVQRRQAARTRDSVLRVIDERRYRPVFQPIVELSTRQVAGFEALTRFADGRSPESWFRKAAEVDLATHLQQACLLAAVREADDLPPGWLSVNLSPGIVEDCNLIVGSIRDRRLVVEVTEDEAIDDYQSLRETLARLGGSVGLAVDDAGAGFASLRHIIELKPQYVKLDMQMVRGVDGDPARAAMVAGMVHFARETGCQIIAEGIETEEERATLASLGVELGQGHLLGRPAAAHEIAEAA